MKEKREIKNRWTGQIICSGEVNSLAELAAENRSPHAKLALEWVDEWIQNMRSAFTPELPNPAAEATV